MYSGSEMPGKAPPCGALAWAQGGGDKSAAQTFKDKPGGDSRCCGNSRCKTLAVAPREPDLRNGRAGGQ